MTPAITTQRYTYRMRNWALTFVAGLLAYCQPIFTTPLINTRPQTPAFEQLTGKGVVLALFDLHRDTHPNGTCTSLDPRALIAAHAALWSHETLVKTASQPCSGLRIYDVCGSGTNALDTILSELKKNGCNHNVTGIITFTSASVYFSIKNLLSRLKIPQTIIWRDIDPIPEPSNHEQQFIRIKSEEKAMSLLELTKSLNWTYVTTKSSDSRDASDELRSFLDTAAKYSSNLCLSMPDTQTESIDMDSSISSSTALLYFINGLSPDGQHTPANLSNSTMRVTLFVTDNDTDLNQIVLNTTTSGLLLKEDVPNIKDVFLGDYLINKSGSGLNNGSSLAWEWLEGSQFCVRTKTKESGAANHTKCDHSSINKFISEALNLKASHAAIESVRRILAREVALFELSDEDIKDYRNEKEFDSGGDTNSPKDMKPLTTAPSSANTTNNYGNHTNVNAGANNSKITNMTSQLPEQYLASRMVFKVSNLTRALEPNTSFSLFATIGPVFQKVGQINSSFHPLDKTRWRLISEKLKGSHCPGYCPACTRCAQNSSQLQQQHQQHHHQQGWPAPSLKYYRPGSLYVALVIPLEQSASCETLPSKEENSKIVEQFLESIDGLQDEESTSLLGYTLGGIVIDSCQSNQPPHHRRQPPEESIHISPCYTLKDTLNISRQVSNQNIVSYIHLPNLNSFSTAKIGESRSKTSTIPDITVSRIGSFLDAIQVTQYVKVILKVFASLRWTYLTVVCSENPLMVELQRRLIAEARKKNMCIRDLIKMSELRASGLLDGRHTFLQEESSAVILLTDAHDTHDFLRSVTKAYNSSHIFNFLFFPWNSALHPSLGTNLFQSSILVEINDPVANEIPKNISSLSVSELESQLELCLLSPSSSVYCPTGTINRGPTEPVLASYVASFVSAIGHSLTGLHSQICPDGEEGLCKAYLDWSRVMSLLRQRLRVGPVSLFNNSRKFDSSGTLRVNYAIKNLQRIRGGFRWTQVGEFNTNGSLSLNPKSVRGYNALQDVMNPVSQCKRWCPRCYQCDLTTSSSQSQANNFALYMPGDVLITAVMPVRKRGQTPFECGSINTEDDADQLVLSLLYAVTTAKQRHPGLLDGVNPGLLILDSCATRERALMVTGNFESCFLSIRLQRPDNNRQRRDAGNNNSAKTQSARIIDYYRTWGASPRLSPVYISVGTSDVLDALTSSISDFRKPVLAVDQQGRSRRAERESDLSDTTLSLSLAARTRMEAIVSLLLKFQWTHVSIVASESIENRKLIKLFNDLAKEAKLCVYHVLMLEDPELNGDDIFRHSNRTRGKSKLKLISENPLLKISSDVPSSFACALRDLAKDNTTRVAFALVSEEHFLKLNALVKENGLSIIWIFDQSDSGWEEDLSSASIPLGSFTIGRQTQVYRGFKEYYTRQSNRRIPDENMNQAMSKWLDEQWDTRFGCDLPGQDSNYGVACPREENQSHVISPVTTDVIRAADAVLFALQTEYAAKCGNKGGLCAKFARQKQPITLASFQKVLVNAENDSFQFSPSREVDTSIAIYNRQAKENGSHLVQVAEWRNRILTPTKGRQIKLYDRIGEELDRNNADLLMPPPSCIGTRCSCVNIPTDPTPTIKSLNSSTMSLTLRREGYSKSTGQFTGTIWATVVMTVAAAGVLTAIGIFFYLLYKYCSGTGGGRRYSLLGMLLLFAIVIQFATMLPFVFTANELICEMRYFAPGFGYSLTLGIILVKLMNLYDYRMIGLGGTLSGMNQLLMVLFVAGVQVAVGAQRWLLKGSVFVRVVTYYGVTMYGCVFDKLEFVYYLGYPMFLQIICLLYSIGMYKEKRNLREAKYVLIASTLCIFVWVSWLLVYFLRPDDLTQPAIAVGILVNACMNLAVIFIPKIHMMATLKYDVNKTSQDHYSTKADSDFFFERPFSLPGTLKTSVSDKTYSRSYTAFQNFDHSSGSV